MGRVTTEVNLIRSACLSDFRVAFLALCSYVIQLQARVCKVRCCVLVTAIAGGIQVLCFWYCFSVLCFRYSVSGTVFQVLCFRYCISGTVFQVLCFWYCVSGTVVSGTLTSFILHLNPALIDVTVDKQIY